MGNQAGNQAEKPTSSSLPSLVESGISYRNLSSPRTSFWRITGTAARGRPAWKRRFAPRRARSASSPRARAAAAMANSSSPRSSSDAGTSTGPADGRQAGPFGAVQQFLGPGQRRKGAGDAVEGPRREGSAREGPAPECAAPECRTCSERLTASHVWTISSTVAGKDSCREPSGRNTCGLRRTILAVRPRATSSRSKELRSWASRACRTTWSRTSPSSAFSSASPPSVLDGFRHLVGLLEEVLHEGFVGEGTHPGAVGAQLGDAPDQRAHRVGVLVSQGRRRPR